MTFTWRHIRAIAERPHTALSVMAAPLLRFGMARQSGRASCPRASHSGGCGWFREQVHLISILLILLIGGTFVGGAAYSAFRAKELTGGKRLATAAGYGLMAVGGLGFFVSPLSSLGGLQWLPSSFEWPVGSARGILVMPDGRHVVPHTASGRIQVYDAAWRFLRGWHVDAGGGVFVLRNAATNQIEVITARRHLRYLYELDGSLVSQATYSPRRYSDLTASGISSDVPTRWWLWLFTSPAHSWIVLALGGLLLLLAGRMKAKR